MSFFLLPQFGATALINASLNGHVNVVEKLLAAGADPNHQSEVRNLVARVMLIHVQMHLFLIKSFIISRPIVTTGENHFFLGQ